MISILMNGYNAQKFLKEAIDSIYAQTYKSWEIIFIDNCSTDNTEKIVKSYDQKIKYYKTDKNISLGKARNFGLSKCKGEYIAFLDTDDLWLPNKLKEQIVQLENYNMSYGSAIWIDENGDEFKRECAVYTSGDILKQQLTRYEINMQSVIIKRDFLEKNSLNFNSEFEFSPDYNLFLKICALTKVGVINHPLVKYRVVKNSLTNKKIDKWAYEFRQTLKEIEKINNNYPKAMQKAYAKAAFYDAKRLIKNNQRTAATKELSKYKFISFVYFFLWLISYSKFLWKFL